MAYLPGEPWNPAYSYSQGNTCTFNGFTYQWIPSWKKSNAGKNPVEDEIQLIPSPGFNPASARRTGRGWSLCNWTSPLIPPRRTFYEYPVGVFERLRGLPENSIGWYIYPGGGNLPPLSGLYLAYYRRLWYATAEGPVTDNDVKYTYNTPMWDEPAEYTCIEMVPKNEEKKIYTTYAETFSAKYTEVTWPTLSPIYYGLHNGQPCGPGKVTSEFQLKFLGTSLSASVNDYNILQAFGKTFNYKYKLEFTNVKTSVKSIQEGTGSIESGSFRDGFFNDIILSPHEDVIPEDCVVNKFGFEVTSVSPDYDS